MEANRATDNVPCCSLQQHHRGEGAQKLFSATYDRIDVEGE